MIPAALALGEQYGIDGTHFLRAVVLGYDVGTRVLMAMGGPAYQTDTHRSTHAAAGTFCAAAAAGCAASLDARQMRLLLDYASQQSAGFGVWQRDTEHIEKAFVFGGMTARSGVTAALLVRAGWTGVEDVFSGPDNFFEAYRPERQAGGGGGSAGRTLRGHAHQHQEMERGLAHTGAARRAGNHVQASAVSTPTTCRRWWCVWRATKSSP